MRTFPRYLILKTLLPLYSSYDFLLNTMNFKTILIIVTITTVIHVSAQNSAEEDGVMGKIKSGFKLATKLLGLDRASGVAQLVSETFGGGAQQKYQKGPQGQNLFSGFFRILGLDAGKLGAFAINGFIFLAQMISTSFKLRPHEKVAYQRSSSNDLPMDWFVNNAKLSKLMQAAKDKDLPEKIIGYVQDRASEDDTACIQLLICKTAPFIWGMQHALDTPIKKGHGKGSDPMFRSLPTMDDVIENGDLCEERYPLCQYLE